MGARILRADVGEWRDPADVFAALHADAPYAFWLDSGAYAEEGMSYMGSASVGARLVTADVTAGTVMMQVLGVDEPASFTDASVLDVLATEIDGEPGEPGFDLGWVGWFGYEWGAALTGAPISESATPDAAWLLVDRMIVFDHTNRSISLVARAGDGADDRTGDGADEWIAETRRAVLSTGPHAVPPVAPTNAVPRWRHEPETYAALIGDAHEAIRRGDAYQLCLTNEIRVDLAPDPVEVYFALRSSSPVHHGGLLRFGDVSLVSASPEQFLHVEAGRATTKPIKGTRPRGNNPAHDELLRAELIASEKERAENLMIVDLMRNDLGRVAKLGTVNVPVLLDVESYASVHQLVSTVQAELAPGVGPLDVVAATFPAGSMTGAPKLSAMSILQGLEGGPRGIYAGAFGYLSRAGTIDLAMVIRSIVIDPTGVSIGTGGGITALSVINDEIDETHIKARALLRALGIDEKSNPARRDRLIR